MQIVVEKNDSQEMQAYKNAIIEEASKDEFYQAALDKCPATFSDLFKYIGDKVKEAIVTKDARIMKIDGGACVGSDFIMPATKEFFIDYDAREEAKKKKEAEQKAKADAVKADIAKRQANTKKEEPKKETKPVVNDVPKEEPKPKKEEPKGYQQVDLFGLLGEL